MLAPNYKDEKKVTKKKKNKSAFHTQRSSNSILSQKSYFTQKPEKNSLLKAGGKKTKKVKSSTKLSRSSSNQANMFERYRNEPGKP